MCKILIFGNSSLGKSTLAKALARAENLAHLDLDTLAWLPSTPPERAPLSVSEGKIGAFIASHKGWVIEGCYTDLLELASPDASEVIFMNLSVDQCVENAKRRPWEPHKYSSKEVQDQNLDMLIDWIKQYETQNNVFSYAAHTNFTKILEVAKRCIQATIAVSHLDFIVSLAFK